MYFSLTSDLRRESSVYETEIVWLLIISAHLTPLTPRSCVKQKPVLTIYILLYALVNMGEFNLDLKHRSRELSVFRLFFIARLRSVRPKHTCGCSCLPAWHGVLCYDYRACVTIPVDWHAHWNLVSGIDPIQYHAILNVYVDSSIVDANLARLHSCSIISPNMTPTINLS